MQVENGGLGALAAARRGLLHRREVAVDGRRSATSPGVQGIDLLRRRRAAGVFCRVSRRTRALRDRKVDEQGRAAVARNAGGQSSAPRAAWASATSIEDLAGRGIGRQRPAAGVLCLGEAEGPRWPVGVQAHHLLGPACWRCARTGGTAGGRAARWRSRACGAAGPAPRYQVLHAQFTAHPRRSAGLKAAKRSRGSRQPDVGGARSVPRHAGQRLPGCRPSESHRPGPISMGRTSSRPASSVPGGRADADQLAEHLADHGGQ